MHIGEYLTLRCEVVYDDVLDVAFIWTHNGQQIMEEYDERIVSISISQNNKKISVNNNIYILAK